MLLAEKKIRGGGKNLLPPVQCLTLPDPSLLFNTALFDGGGGGGGGGGRRTILASHESFALPNSNLVGC